MRFAWFFKEHKIITGVMLLNLIILVVLIIMIIIKASKTATIDILTIPSIAKVQIDGNEYSSGAYQIRPGSYNAEVRADGFITKTIPINAQNGEISKIYVYLIPDEGNLNYYAQHEEDWENMRLINDEEATRVYKILSIQEELPINYVEQNEIEYEGAVTASKYILINKNNAYCEAYYCLRIATIFDKNEDTAKAMLAEKGFNLDDYGVEWKIYTGETLEGDALMEMREGEWGE